MPDYIEDRKYSDKFIPKIKQIVGPLLLNETDFEIDAKEATDLIVLYAKDMRIAARIRRPGFAERYGNQITIRAHRDSGAETELLKIVNGWGDWMFYGHDDNKGNIFPWYLIDLAAFRAALIRDGQNGIKLRYGDKSNHDGTYFKWFDLTSFPKTPPILVASS
jgi:hypothetical protein